MIRLEAARSRAYHAADAEPLAAADLAAVPAERLGDLVLEPHPSLALLRSPHPVVTIWAMNAGEQEVGPVDQIAAEDALVLRPRLEVAVHRLPHGGAAFLEALAGGLTLGEAAERAAADDTRFDLTANLASLVGSGAVIAFALARSSSEGSAS